MVLTVEVRVEQAVALEVDGVDRYVVPSFVLLAENFVDKIVPNL